MKFLRNRNLVLCISFLLVIFGDRYNLAQDPCKLIEGAKIIADDGKYLGKISNEFDSESILNEYGHYGNKYNPECIWNEYGTYGNEFSSLSPFNLFTSNPPILIKNGEIIGYLTKNKSLKNAIDPYILLTCEFGTSSSATDLREKTNKSKNKQKESNKDFVSDNHWIQKVIDNGKYILLEDKSLWEVSPIDVIYSALWLPISNIMIVKSKNPSYPYYLINTDDKEKVEAKTKK